MSKNNGLRLVRDGESRSSNLTYWDLLEWLKKQPPSLLKSQDVTILDALTEEFLPVTRYDKTIDSHGVLDDPHLILVMYDEFSE